MRAGEKYPAQLRLGLILSRALEIREISLSLASGQNDFKKCPKDKGEECVDEDDFKHRHRTSARHKKLATSSIDSASPCALPEMKT